jgi:hypothetical protein
MEYPSRILGEKIDLPATKKRRSGADIARQVDQYIEKKMKERLGPDRTPKPQEPVHSCLFL